MRYSYQKEIEDISKETQKALAELADAIENLSKREWDTTHQRLLEISETEEYVGREGKLMYDNEIRASFYTTPRWFKFFTMVQMVKSEKAKSALRLCEHFVFNQNQTLKDLLCDLIVLGSDQVATAIQKS